jgi:hypothetical protein
MWTTPTRIVRMFALSCLVFLPCAQVSSQEQQPPPPPPKKAPATPDDRAQQPGGPMRVNNDARIAAEFNKRVQAYVELHKKLEDSVPKLPKEATPEQIDQYERALARLIETARKDAKQGDIFTTETRAYFRRLLAAVFAGPDGKKLKASINDENPGPIQLRVNGRYPDTVPLSTMPPQVLAMLPRLPEELEFRFIGERLILLDKHAHLVADYLDRALPR